MSKRILWIQTGGTFSSCYRENGEICNGKFNPLLNSSIKDLCQEKDLEIVEKSPFRILSENMTVDKLQDLIRYIQGLDLQEYTGVVLTHGSDTLAYTANLLGMVFSGCGVPFILTAADLPLENPESNGIRNFLDALILSDSGLKGVFVVWQNKNGDRIVHRATEIISMDYREDAFYSRDNKPYGEIIEDELKSLEAISKDKITYLSEKSVTLDKGIMIITPYPGMSYKNFDYSGITKIIHNTYHTGMFCSSGSNENIETLFELTDNLIPVYFCGVKTEKPPYENHLGDNHPVYFLKNHSVERAYARALLGIL